MPAGRSRAQALMAEGKRRVSARKVVEEPEAPDGKTTCVLRSAIEPRSELRLDEEAFRWAR